MKSCTSYDGRKEFVLDISIMKYFISPNEETELIINATQFRKNLIVQWSDIELNLINSPERNYSLEWIIKMNNRQLEGALDRTGQSVSLDGDVRDCAKFAIWFRSQINPKYKLFFYDQSYTADIELHEEITEEEIIRLFIN